jgi:hypothetical protein
MKKVTSFTHADLKASHFKNQKNISQCFQILYLASKKIAVRIIKDKKVCFVESAIPQTRAMFGLGS